MLIRITSLMTLLGLWSAARAACGDSAIDTDEDCDDGNLDDGDGCSSECAVEDGWGRAFEGLQLEFDETLTVDGLHTSPSWSSSSDGLTVTQTQNSDASVTDDDVVTDPVEYALGTDETFPDSDGDGIDDLTEIGGLDSPTDTMATVLSMPWIPMTTATASTQPTSSMATAPTPLPRTPTETASRTTSTMTMMAMGCSPATRVQAVRTVMDARTTLSWMQTMMASQTLMRPRLEPTHVTTKATMTGHLMAWKGLSGQIRSMPLRTATRMASPTRKST